MPSSSGRVSQKVSKPRSTEADRPAAGGAIEASSTGPEQVMLHLQRTIGNQAVLRLLRQGSPVLQRSAPVRYLQRKPPAAPAPATAAHPDHSDEQKDADQQDPATDQQADAASIQAALGSVKVVERTETELLLRPDLMFKLVPANTPAKAEAYRGIARARKRLRRAEAAANAAKAHPKNATKLKKAITEYEAAQHALTAAVEKARAFVLSRALRSDKQLKDLHRERARLKKRLDRLERHGKPADSKQVDDLKARLSEIDQEESKRKADLKAQVDQTSFEPVPTERHYYQITIDGEQISMFDHVEAYMTVVESGLEVRAKGEKKNSVNDVLEKSDLSESRKKILRTISAQEGHFTSLNTYDRAVLTWGMVQWTGGDHSDLTAALTVIKEAEPDAFKARFEKYGIDVVGNQLVVKGADGTVVKGDAAAKAVQGSPILTAVMARAGLDPAIQLGEIKAANETEVERPLNAYLTVQVPSKEPGKGKPRKVRIRARDIFTSEYGVGVLVDQTIHGGFPRRALQRALSKFLQDKQADPADVQSWAADAEKALIPVVAKWPKRAQALKDAGCSTDPGSFKP